MMNIPNIALVGNAPADKIDVLNALLGEDDLTDLCDITLYGADGQPEMEALQDAVDDFIDGQVDGVVCMPLKVSPRKALMSCLKDEGNNATTVYINPSISMASVKGMVTKEEAEASLTTDDIKVKATILATALKRDLNILNPRIAILALNEELSVDESTAEVKTIVPAITQLTKEGIQVFGPYSADKFFESENMFAFDAVLAMYEGQCSTAHQNASNESTLTIVTGTPIAFIASQPEDILKAVFQITTIQRNRKEYDKAFTNPLPKLYHERKEDGEKARFAVKKKGFNPAEHRRENITYTTQRTPQQPAPQTKEA